MGMYSQNIQFEHKFVEIKFQIVMNLIKEVQFKYFLKIRVDEMNLLVTSKTKIAYMICNLMNVILITIDQYY